MVLELLHAKKKKQTATSTGAFSHIAGANAPKPTRRAEMVTWYKIYDVALWRLSLQSGHSTLQTRPSLWRHAVTCSQRWLRMPTKSATNEQQDLRWTWAMWTPKWSKHVRNVLNTSKCSLRPFEAKNYFWTLAESVKTSTMDVHKNLLSVKQLLIHKQSRWKLLQTSLTTGWDSSSGTVSLTPVRLNWSTAVVSMLTA